jgi:hypothetical protein
MMSWQVGEGREKRREVLHHLIRIQIRMKAMGGSQRGGGFHPLLERKRERRTSAKRVGQEGERTGDSPVRRPANPATVVVPVTRVAGRRTVALRVLTVTESRVCASDERGVSTRRSRDEKRRRRRRTVGGKVVGSPSRLDPSSTVALPLLEHISFVFADDRSRTGSALVEVALLLTFEEAEGGRGGRNGGGEGESAGEGNGREKGEKLHLVGVLEFVVVLRER